MGNKIAIFLTLLLTVIPLRSVAQTPLTPEDLAAMTPGSPNPYLALLPTHVAPDWKYWNAYATVHSPLRAETRAPLTRQTPVPIGEVEPNGSATNAQPIDIFGTDTGKVRAVEIHGSIGDAPEPIFSGTPAEDDSSIPLATTVTLAELQRKRFSATIGNGPYGSSGTGTGDFDFFRVPNLGSGEVLVVETLIDHPFDGTDTVVAVYSADGTLIGFNDDADITVSLASRLVVSLPFAGDYFVCVGGFVAPEVPPLLSDPFNGASGPGVGSEGPYEVIIGRGESDTDFFEFNLRAGDILGFNSEGFINSLSLRTESNFELITSANDVSFIYPLSSPLPGGNAVSGAYVIAEDGLYRLRATGSTPGNYRIDLQVFRNTLETATSGERQILFIDFDGAIIDTSIWGTAPGLRELSPFVDFLPRWGFPDFFESLFIDSIMAVVEKQLRDDLALFSNNSQFSVDIRNSRDHPDPWGQPNVSRIIVGGTVEESGIFTIGIAESIDPGNFAREETGLVLLDFLSAPAPDPNSLNSIDRHVSLSKIDLIAIGVGTIIAHEAGHYLGSFHTSRLRFTPPNIMDEGGDLLNTLGAGDDNIMGTADDIEVMFGTDVYSFFEGFSGVEDTLNTTAFAMSSSFNPNLIYVDFSKAINGTGIASNPFNNLADAVAGASPGAVIRILPSSGADTIRITKSLTLRNDNPPGGTVRIGVP